ncbi:isoleucine--tRNA ligase [bacterium]|nr:isoleucine--tRNA ligase [bacterium]
MGKIPEVDSRAQFSVMEDRINEFWKKEDIFKKSLENRSEGKRYSFVDGPPFVTGTPHYGSLLVSIPKDIIPRYWTMKGYRVRRVWGWDCHGLPIEARINKKLKVKGNADVETRIGVDKYVQECRKYVEQGISDWRWYIEKIGRWVDLDNAYRTMDPEFNESVIWAFKQIWDKDLIYKGKRVSLYSTDTCTPVSNFEVTMDDTYEDVEDLSIFVKFSLKTKKFDKYTESKPVRLVAWTTTPWTIPANFALALNKDLDYSVVKYESEYLMVAASRLEYTFGENEYEVVHEAKGREFEGLEYEPAYDFFVDQATENDWKVYLSEEVVEDEGTGVLHLAPGFGEVDFNLGKELGLSGVVHIDEAGNMLDGDWEGVYIRDASPLVTDDLKKQGKLLRSEKYVHRLPFYRGKNPLIYMSQDSYFVDIQKIKPKMLELQEKINWIPDVFKKRFENVLETAPDWAISRNRYWATVMPVWESEDGEQIVVGSIEEMMEYTDQVQKVELDDGKVEYQVEGKKMTLHRDVCDKLVFKKDGKEYRRIPEVLDSWMDAGSVPFAEHHYPFENKEVFEQAYPADFIVEYTGQIRAWFNVLFRMSLMLFDDVPYKNVICHGVMFGDDGRKMSKSYENYPDPKLVLKEKGGEALRLYFMSTSIMVGRDIHWSDDILNDQVKDVLIPIWNTYRYLSLYSNMHNWTPITTEYTSDAKLDKWIESYMRQTTKKYAEALEQYDIPASVKLIQPCIDNISKWWIRRSRDRFAEGNAEALQTLYATMVLFAKTFAPQMPFLTEEMYQNLVVKTGVDGALESVHLEDYPVFQQKEIDEELLREMEVVREICSNGLKIREDNSLKLRQPLSKAYVAIKKDFLRDIVQSELNVKEIEYSEKPMEGEDLVTIGEYEKYVSLDINLTEELVSEGYINDFVRQYQNARKKGEDINYEDSVKLTVNIDEDKVREIVEKYLSENQKGLKLKSFEIGDSVVGNRFELGKAKVSLTVEK